MDEEIKTLKREAGKKFAELPEKKRRRAAGIIIGAMRRMGYFSRGGYKVVRGGDQKNRPFVSAETGGELQSLTADERNRLIAIARAAARNSVDLEGILHQVEFNVIGVEGGKAIFQFPPKYEKEERTIREAFAEWAQEAEFFEDLNLQTLLTAILRTQLIGGDLVLVFDNGITSRSTGQVITFEPDCIGNISTVEFEKYFPGYSQQQGVIKDVNNKTVGVIVSWAERGKSVYRLFDKDGKRLAWTLIKPDGVKWRDSLFIFYRGVNRINQVRGSSRLWPGLGTVTDLTDLKGYEIQAAKKNSQTIAQVTQSEADVEAEIDSELDPEIPVNDFDEETTREAVREAEEEAEQIPVKLDEIASAGCIYDVLPPGVKMELLDTKHPNNNLVEFARLLHGGVAFAIGLGNVHSSGKADSSYSAAMAEMLISNQEFRSEFHKLKTGVLDWIFNNWVNLAQERGEIPPESALPRHWRRTCVKWQRPQERSINPVDEQNALNLGLKNGTILYRDKLGPDWRGKLADFAEEVEFCRKHNLVHPQSVTVSGQTVDPANKEGNE